MVCRKKKDEPNLIDFLDLVALGTICDVVPLIGLNRAIVKQGLKVLRSKKNFFLNTKISYQIIINCFLNLKLSQVLAL